MLPHDLCLSNCTDSQIAMGTGSSPLQHISSCISAEFDFHSTTLILIALTWHCTHIHTLTRVDYHFHADLTIGSFKSHTFLFQSNLHYNTWSGDMEVLDISNLIYLCITPVVLLNPTMYKSPLLLMICRFFLFFILVLPKNVDIYLLLSLYISTKRSRIILIAWTQYIKFTLPHLAESL